MPRLATSPQMASKESELVDRVRENTEVMLQALGFQVTIVESD